MSFLVTLTLTYIFSGLVHFKRIHKIMMATKIPFRIQLIDSFTHNRVETVVYAFLECFNVSNLSRSIECWVGRLVDRHFKLSDVDKAFGTLPINITIKTSIICLLLILCCNWSDHGHMTILQNWYWGAMLLSNTQTQSCQVHVLNSQLLKSNPSELRQGTQRSLGFLQNHG